MTDKEKAKAYDEALERARKMLNMILDNELLGFPDQIREIFPQLRENEKMLREIKRYIKEQGDKPTGLPNGTVAVADMIAYLEKQKVKVYDDTPYYTPEEVNAKIEKPIDVIPKIPRQEYLYHLLANGVITFSDYEFLMRNKGRKPADLSEMMVHKEPYIAPVPTSIVADEQKSAEWAELQSEFKNINEAFENGKKEVLTHPKKYGLCEQKPVDYDAELKKCKDNPLYFFDKYVTIKQKPMEWSEEDETAFGDLMWCIKQAAKSAKDENDMGNIWFAENWVKNRLKSLRPQPKPEWNEEDDKMCNSILNELTLHLVYDGTYTGTTLGKKYKYGSEIRWIKSLPERFNLQPKEEQSEYDENMDKECIKLCNTLNSIPSVNTFESCCGHLKDRYSVWFFCNDVIAISRLGRSVERNYSDGKWELVVDSTDTHPTGVFWLRSKVPFQSYDEMEESVNELCVDIQYWFNTKFDSYFNGNACK